jgi:hypothetical protein
MENRLRRLNAELSAILQELKSEYAAELNTAHIIPQDVKSLPQQMPELETSVELLSELQFTLTPPLYTLIDGIFGKPRPLFQLLTREGKVFIFKN